MRLVYKRALLRLAEPAPNDTYLVPSLGHIYVKCIGSPSADLAESLREELRLIANSRRNRPGVQPIQRISLSGNLRDPLLQFELERLVPSVMWHNEDL